MRYLLILTCLYAQQSFSQPILLQGQVRETLTHSGLAARLQLQLQKDQTLTNEQGQFTLLLKQRVDTLVIWAVGYVAKSIAISYQDTLPLLVTLEPDALALEEVTVQTGYEKVPGERITGSFAHAGKELLNKQAGTFILSRIDGLLPGLYANNKVGAAGLQIRGVSTLLSNARPLVVLDNFPYEGDINNLNPNDIENITLLKDAAAASIWGARAGNGVIVITTKKAKAGKLKVEWGANSTWVAPPNLQYLPLMNSKDFIDVERWLFEKQFNFADTANLNRPAFSPVYELLFAARNSAISTATLENELNRLSKVDIRNELLDHIYRSPLLQQYSLAITGGTDKYTWRTSWGYDKNNNELAAQYNRLSLRLEQQMAITKQIQWSTSLSYTAARSEDGKQGYYSLNTARGARIYPYQQLADDAGQAIPFYKDYRQTYLDTVGRGRLLDWHYYPLTNHQHTRVLIYTQHLLLNTALRWSIMKGVNAELRYQYERQEDNGRDEKERESYEARHLINTYSREDALSGELKRAIPVGTIIGFSHNRRDANNVRGQISYSFIRGWHSINGLAGAEIRDIKNRGNNYQVYGYDPGTLSFQPVDFVNLYPTYITGSLAQIPSGIGFTDITNRYVSFFSNAAYSYKKRYVLSGSVRRDASNLFGVATNQKWNPLWSVGTAWHINKEPFFKEAAIQLLSLRSSFGYSGNIDLNRSAVTTLRLAGNDPQSGYPFSVINQYPNPDLRWEKTSMWNVGVDFSLWRGKIAGSVEHYRKKGVDLIGEALLDYTTGLGRSTITRNTAAMNGRGWDITLQVKPLSRLFKWSGTLNFSFATNKVTRYYRVDTSGATMNKSDWQVSLREGYSLYSLFSYQWAGLDPANGNPQGVLAGVTSTDYNNLTRLAASTDMIYSGLTLPPYSGNMLNVFAYKNWELSVNLVYKLGYHYREPSINYYNLFYRNDGHKDYSKRWQNSGDEQHTNVPSMLYPANAARDELYTYSTVLVKPGDHIRLQFVNLSHTLWNKRIAGIRFEQVRFFIIGSNLGIVWKKAKGQTDPDFGITIPPSRSVTVGLNFQF